MRPVDALAFLFTACAVLVVNAVLAVALGCSFYLLQNLYHRLHKSAVIERDPMVKVAAVGGAR